MAKSITGNYEKQEDTTIPMSFVDYLKSAYMVKSIHVIKIQTGHGAGCTKKYYLF